MTTLVKLNVGGVKYITTNTTLESIPESFFFGLLSGRLATTKIKDYIFIDRNGTIFEYVLSYLRDTHSWQLPRNLELIEKIKIEANFYLLLDLVKICEEGVLDLTFNIVTSRDGITFGYLPQKIASLIENKYGSSKYIPNREGVQNLAGVFHLCRSFGYNVYLISETHTSTIYFLRVG